MKTTLSSRAVTDAWLPADLADGIDQDELRRTPLYSLLSAADVTVDRMQHEFTAEIAGPRYAQLLATSIGAALLRVNRVAFSGGTAYHLLSILLSPNRSRIIVSQSAEELESGDGFAIAHDVRRPGVYRRTVADVVPQGEHFSCLISISIPRSDVSLIGSKETSQFTDHIVGILCSGQAARRTVELLPRLAVVRLES
jgi:hypothetical protein